MGTGLNLSPLSYAILKGPSAFIFECKLLFILRFINSRIESRTGRKYHHFASDDQVSAYLRVGGFDASYYTGSMVFNQLSCLKKLYLDGDRIFKIVSTFKTWLARPV